MPRIRSQPLLHERVHRSVSAGALVLDRGLPFSVPTEPDSDNGSDGEEHEQQEDKVIGDEPPQDKRKAVLFSDAEESDDDS